MAPVGLSQTPPRAITAHCTPYLPADGKARFGLSVPDVPEQDEARLLFPFALLENRLDVTCLPESFVAGERQHYAAAAGHAGYTVRRLRPFARRRLSTFRPPCVFIRSRKP